MSEIIRVCGFNIYFWTVEGISEVHFHVSREGYQADATQFWIYPDGSLVLEQNNSGLSEQELQRVILCIEAFDIKGRLIQLWRDKFGYLWFKELRG